MIFESHNQIKAHGSIKIYQKRSRIVGIVILTYMLTQAIKYKSIRKSVNHILLHCEVAKILCYNFFASVGLA